MEPTTLALVAIILILVMIVIMGGAWAIYRELYIRRLNAECYMIAKDSVGSCRDFHNTLQRFQDKIESHEVIAKDNRDLILDEIRDLNQQLVEMERRFEGALRVTQQGSHVSVITGGTNQNTFGENHGGQTQK